MAKKEHDNSAKFNVHSLGNAAVETPSVKENSPMSRPHADVATQYPHYLFPYHTFNIHDGWILGPNEVLLLWVPPANHVDLLSSSSRSHILGVIHPTELDFSNFKCGTEWAQCHELLVHFTCFGKAQCYYIVSFCEQPFTCSLRYCGEMGLSLAHWSWELSNSIWLDSVGTSGISVI